MITRVRSRVVWVVVTGMALAGLISLIVITGLLTDEYWCSDRTPWWGPPQDPGSSCTGAAWARDHPDEYPWTMPK